MDSGSPHPSVLLHAAHKAPLSNWFCSEPAAFLGGYPTVLESPTSWVSISIFDSPSQFLQGPVFTAGSLSLPHTAELQWLRNLGASPWLVTCILHACKTSTCAWCHQVPLPAWDLECPFYGSCSGLCVTLAAGPWKELPYVVILEQSNKPHGQLYHSKGPTSWYQSSVLGTSLSVTKSLTKTNLREDLLLLRV